MFRIVLFYEVITFSIIFIMLSFINIIRNLREGSKKRAIIFIILNIIVVIISFKTMNIFGFCLKIFTTEIISLGILNFIISLYDGNEFYYYNVTFVIILILACFTYFLGLNFINNLFFDSMPSKINTHYETIEIKREAKRMNPQEELEMVLKILIDKNIPINCKTINQEIVNLNYRRYNGIYCYYFKEFQDYYEIGMTIGENNYFFQNKDMTKPFNFKVNKQNFNVITD